MYCLAAIIGLCYETIWYTEPKKPWWGVAIVRVLRIWWPELLVSVCIDFRAVSVGARRAQGWARVKGLEQRESLLIRRSYNGSLVQHLPKSHSSSTCRQLNDRVSYKTQTSVAAPWKYMILLETRLTDCTYYSRSKIDWLNN